MHAWPAAADEPRAEVPFEDMLRNSKVLLSLTHSLSSSLPLPLSSSLSPSMSSRTRCATPRCACVMKDTELEKL